VNKQRKEESMMYNVLICDDQVDIVNALKIYLKPEGYRLLEAFNGEQALEIVSREEIHLILLDVMMPGMDGITATAKIREFSNVPIIFLTAKSETEDMVLGLNVGADDYITKPFVRWRFLPGCAVSFAVMPGWAARLTQTQGR
jgi:DNA-binding response OmpR family regulator